jgi:hypothetical protein
MFKWTKHITISHDDLYTYILASVYTYISGVCVCVCVCVHVYTQRLSSKSTSADTLTPGFSLKVET